MASIANNLTLERMLLICCGCVFLPHTVACALQVVPLAGHQQRRHAQDCGGLRQQAAAHVHLRVSSGSAIAMTSTQKIASHSGVHAGELILLSCHCFNLICSIDMNWHAKYDWSGFTFDSHLYPYPADTMNSLRSQVRPQQLVLVFVWMLTRHLALAAKCPLAD